MSMFQERLLVVEDEIINREIIANYLGGASYELTVVEDGEQALACLAGDAGFDAVILDRMMPGIDGLEVLQRLQADRRLRSIPVIMQTAAAGHEQVAEGLRMGAYYYLTKPYHRDALLAVVRSALDLVRRRRDLAREIEEYRGIIGMLNEGRFRLRTLKEAHSLAAAISGLGDDPASAALGLVELLINAIEHGNLGITFEEKSRLLAAERWEAEVEARLVQPECAAKFVEVELMRQSGVVRIAIRDQGAGFDWRRFLDWDEARALYPNGRGIAMTRQIAFHKLEYLEPGNAVIVTLAGAH